MTYVPESSWQLFRYPTIMSGIVYRWMLGDLCQVNASRDGVSLHGHFPIWKDMKNVDHLAVILELAKEAHRALSATRRGADYDPPHIGGFLVFNPAPMCSREAPKVRHPEKTS